MLTVKLTQFEGPLDLLLQLIEQQELDVSQLSLATVTDQYVATLQSSVLPPEELADFLVIAAKLLYLKSKLLLPELVGADDEDGSDLARQLKMYQEFVAAAKVVERIVGERRVLFAREGRLDVRPVFSPPKRLAVDDLRGVFLDILHELEPIVNIPQVTLKRTISLRKKIEEIHALLRGRERTDFRDLLGSAKDKTEVIVTFLALLELVKQRQLAVRQERMFQSITIEAAPTEAV